MSEAMPRPPPPGPPAESHAIARKLALGFGLVSVVAIAMCAALLTQLYRVADLVGDMRHHEQGIRLGAELATAVREQYIQIAHTIVEADRSHLERYGVWYDRIHERARRLEELTPDDARWHVRKILDHTRLIDESFRGGVLTALAADDEASLRRLHRYIEGLAGSSAVHADAASVAVEASMTGAHISATDVTRTGLIVGFICVLLVLVLGVRYTLKLNRSVLEPMRTLSEAARRVGAGELQTRLGVVGEGELQEVATAFDHMATELMARERRLVQAERMAAIGQLAAGVAHEMNNPIAIIRGYLKTMTPDEDAETLADELRILDEEAAACQRIAEDLLAYSRQPALAPELLRMEEFLPAAIERLGERRGGDAPRVEVRATAGELHADPARLRQVFANLLANASWGDAGGVEVRGTPGDDGGYVIEVADRGAGFADAEKDRVFEPFFSGRAGGTGLGLAVCQGIVTAHGGRIDIADREGGGAVVKVELPARPPVTTAPEAPA